jgi:Gas vesicle synthesis protein GvpL/GvpF
MTLLLYGIADCPVGPVDGVGLDGRPLRGVGDERLTAIVSDYAQAQSEQTENTMWDYERVIELMMERGTVLPARFPSVLSNEATALSMLRERRGEFESALERIRGAVELSVRGTWRAGEEITPATSPATGTEYMLDRLRLHQRAREAGRRLDSLDALARASRMRVLPNPEVPVAGTYLVDRERVEKFADLLGEVAEALDQVDLVCTGPWPPFSFVDGAPV